MKTYTSKAGIKRALNDIIKQFSEYSTSINIHNPRTCFSVTLVSNYAYIEIRENVFRVGTVNHVYMPLEFITKIDKNDLPVFYIYLRDDTCVSINRTYS